MSGRDWEKNPIRWSHRAIEEQKENGLSEERWSGGMYMASVSPLFLSCPPKSSGFPQRSQELAPGFHSIERIESSCFCPWEIRAGCQEWQ